MGARVALHVSRYMRKPAAAVQSTAGAGQAAGGRKSSRRCLLHAQAGPPGLQAAVNVRSFAPPGALPAAHRM